MGTIAMISGLEQTEDTSGDRLQLKGLQCTYIKVTLSGLHVPLNWFFMTYPVRLHRL